MNPDTVTFVPSTSTPATLITASTSGGPPGSRGASGLAVLELGVGAAAGQEHPARTHERHTAAPSTRILRILVTIFPFRSSPVDRFSRKDSCAQALASRVPHGGSPERATYNKRSPSGSEIESHAVESAVETRQHRSDRLASIDAAPFIDVAKSRGFFADTGRSLAEIWHSRELLGRLVRREIRARYKDSKLGVVWSLFRPLISLLIYYFAIGKIMGAARNVPDFAIFVFAGLTIWMLYSEIVGGCVRSIVDNSGLVKKVYLPREIFPLSSIGSAIVNFVIQLAVLLIGIAVLSSYRISPDLLLAPLSLLTLLVFGTAIGLLVAALNVYLRDVQHFVEIYLLIFFWASPIVYPFTYVHNALGDGWLSELYLASPVTLSIIGTQKALWSAGSTSSGALVQIWPPELGMRLVIALLASIVLLFIAQRVFARLQGNFAQEL